MSGRARGDHGRHPVAREALLERRGVLRALGIGAGLGATGGLGALLTACGGEDAAAPGAPSATTARVASRAAALDPAQPYWMQGGFAPVRDEVHLTELEVEGNLPPELVGLYVRNGSNPASEPSGHWFMGDGMLHGIRLEEGRAEWYRNRYVRTPMYEARTGFLGAGPPGGANNQSNVAVLPHAGKLLSLGEVGWPYLVDPDELATEPYEFGGALATAMTAHPKVDPVTGRMHFFGYGFLPPFLTYHEVDAAGTLVRSEEIAVAGPTMMHDFAVTDREAIFWELPVVFDLDAAVSGTSMPFTWQPDYGARIGVLPFDSPASAIRWVEIDPCFVFHGVNAHRDGDDVVVDVCRQETAFAEGEDGSSVLHRWRIGTAGEQLTFTDQVVDDRGWDLPSIDRRRAGLVNRSAFFAEFDTSGPAELDMAGVVRWDYETGTADHWDSAPGERVGEVVFAPGGPGEGEGWLLAFAYDQGTDRSHLIVLDATDVAAGPVARVRLPVRVPYGFHGAWVPDDATTYV
jgi:carotenoid cleavage dioxygenase